MPSSPIVDRLERWFASRGWTPFDYQRETWQAQLDGRSGLIQVPTGSGKTYAACLVPLLWAGEAAAAGHAVPQAAGPTLLYITPLRAVARDIDRALGEAAAGLGLDVRIDTRTGDTPQSRRAKQAAALPDVLITTPESLALLVSRAETERQLAAVRAVVLDEWHELLQTKRGTQVELCVRHLEARAPADLPITWALSATIGNVAEAAQAAVGLRREATVVRAEIPRPVAIEVVEPPRFDALPWAGHLGLDMLDPLLERLERGAATLIFTNTRNQAERWYGALFERAGSFAERIALHHGSIDVERRREVEEGIRTGRLSWVVATSSLDLGIDFHPVEVVVQIGSPKGIGRLLQRAGRSGHEPGRPSRLLFVPTHGLELIELAAVRRALADGAVEERRPLVAPRDVLAQHLVTLAAGPGFGPTETFEAVRATAAYGGLDRGEFERVCDFVRYGGTSLAQYPEYRRVVEVEGRVRIADERTARLHRASIGTITSRGMVRLQFTNRKPLGAVEEAFVARLGKGDVFHFGGHTLEFVMMREGTAYVRRAPRGSTRSAATWVGSGLPYSQTLSGYVRSELGRRADGGTGAGADARGASAAHGAPAAPGAPGDGAGSYAAALLAEQARVSALPGAGETLLEVLSTAEAEHLFLYPFEGTRLHEALGALISYRISRDAPVTLTVTANDYGIELRSPEPPAGGLTARLAATGALFDTGGLASDLEAAVNLSELARRRFRGIAQIAGLVFPGYPGNPRPRRELQASATLFYEVFRNHDPGHILLEQARREVLEEELLRGRLVSVLSRLGSSGLIVRPLERPGPLAFPLMVKELAARVSTESLAARVERMKRRWLAEAG